MENQCIYFYYAPIPHCPHLFSGEKRYCHTKKVKKCGDISMEINENTVKKEKD